MKVDFFVGHGVAALLKEIFDLRWVREDPDNTLSCAGRKAPAIFRQLRTEVNALLDPTFLEMQPTDLDHAAEHRYLSPSLLTVPDRTLDFVCALIRRRIGQAFQAMFQRG
jgi:hypothetical protein